MPLGAAPWEIDLLAADTTASAFNSLNARMKQTQQQASDGMIGRPLSDALKFWRVD
jgi:hypothetical protein